MQYLLYHNCVQKTGSWCAAHVRTAWAIHVRQQYMKQQAAAAAASSRPKEQFHSPAAASGDRSPLPLVSHLYGQASGASKGVISDHRSPGLDGLSNTDGKSTGTNKRFIVITLVILWRRD